MDLEDEEESEEENVPDDTKEEEVSKSMNLMILMESWCLKKQLWRKKNQFLKV